jgi:hypothetical protein
VPSAAFLARLSATAATALFFVYGFTVASVALPIKLLDMAWQISVINALINNSTIPLEGVVLAHLAAYLDPSEPRFEAFCKNLRSWAIPATLGFLLIIPLQAYNLAKGVSNFNRSVANYQVAITQNFANLRNAVKTAPNFAQLQKSLIDSKGPTLSPADQRLPLPELRQSLLVAIQQAENTAKTNNNLPGPDQIWAFGKDVLRSILTASAFALAYAAAAKRSAWPESLLVRFSKYLGSLRKFKFTGLSKIVDNYKAKQKSRHELFLTKRRLGDHARKQAELKQQEEKQRRLREKHIKSMRAKQNRNNK